MNKIITKPEEIIKNKQVLYTGNHYLSVPIIDCQNGAINNINIVVYTTINNFLAIIFKAFKIKMAMSIN